MWESCDSSSLHSYFGALPTGEESAPDDVEQAAPPGVVHIDVAAAWRSEEAAFQDFSGKTHISLSFWTMLNVVPFRSANDLHAILCRTASRIPFSVCRVLGSCLGYVSVLARLCLGTLGCYESS